MTRLGIFVSICATFVLVGCSHSYTFTPHPEVDQIKEHALAGKSVAFDMSGVPKRFHASAGGHEFEMHGIRTNVGRMYDEMFADEKVVDDPAKADRVLSLALEFKLESAMGGVRCTADATWEISDGTSTLASGNSVYDSSYPAMSNGGRNCELASMNATAAALDDAMAEL